MSVTTPSPGPVVSKFQHHVFYVRDLEKAKEFYAQVFDLQFSALNHPDSSAAMRVSQQEMYFFSFGYYHHDLCLVKHRKLAMDNHSMMHYTLVVRDATAYKTIAQRLAERHTPVRSGRLIASASTAGVQRALCCQDPDHHWIEVLLKEETHDKK